MPNVKIPLADKFRTFVATLDGYENIDLLLKKIPKGRRADYLFRNRTVVAEQKEQNSEARVAWNNYVIEGHRLGQKYGVNPETDALPLSSFSTDERRGFYRLKGRYIRRFEQYLSEAEKQIANTKNMLEIPNAGGIFVLLNEKSGRTLPHDFIAAIIRLFEEDVGVKPRFANVNGVFWVQNYQGFTIGKYSASAGYMQSKYKHSEANAFGEYMVHQWAQRPPQRGRMIRGYLGDLPLPDK